MIIVRADEIKRIRDLKKWTLVYGRRKTGKTFLLREFIPHDEYFYVKKDRTILSQNNEQFSYETFLMLLKKDIESQKTIIVDEFQRLESGFFDFLHSLKKNGRLILVSSTLCLSKKLISENSSLLGVLAEVPIGLISTFDILKHLEKSGFDNKELFETAIMLKEPISIDYFDEKISARANLSRIIQSSIKTVPALIGETFIEEEKEISAVYEGILRAVSSGKAVSSEISSYLFSRKLIKKDDPSIIQQYLSNLISFGILKRIEVYNKNKFIYKMSSPLSRIFYYADEKYNISETAKDKEISMIIDELMPRIVEDEARALFADKYGLKEAVFEAKDFDIDGILLKFSKIDTAIEVKWKKVEAKDIKLCEENLEKIESKNKIIFVPDKKGLKSRFQLMDVKDLL